MNKLELFPTEIFWWDWNGDKQELSNNIISSHIDNNNQFVEQSDPNLHKQPKYKNLFLFIENCLDQVKNYYDLQCDGLKITTAWANKYKPFTYNAFHRHPMSAFSGVYFITGGAPFTVKDPIVFRSYQSTIPVSKKDEIFFELEPIPGRVIIFPWWLEHGAMNQRNEERWSIAFNSMPHGKINSNDGNNLSSVNLNICDD